MSRKRSLLLLRQRDDADVPIRLSQRNRLGGAGHHDAVLLLRPRSTTRTQGRRPIQNLMESSTVPLALYRSVLPRLL